MTDKSAKRRSLRELIDIVADGEIVAWVEKGYYDRSDVMDLTDAIAAKVIELPEVRELISYAQEVLDGIEDEEWPEIEPSTMDLPTEVFE